MMYLSFYDLQFNPFSNPVDTQYFWCGAPYSKAIDTLKQAAEDDANLLILNGDCGIGKTALIRYLKKELLSEYLSVEIGNEFEDAKGLFNSIAHYTGISSSFTGKGAFFIHFNQYLHNIQAENKKLLLIIDDFCTVNDSLIKELKFLSDIIIEQQKIISILIAGENLLFVPSETNELANSVVATYRLKRLNRSETSSYISHMLGAAGTKADIFSREAIQKIFLLSQGIPGKINRICDRALNIGHELKLESITAAIVEQSTQEFNLPLGVQLELQLNNRPQAEQTKDGVDDITNRSKTRKLLNQPGSVPAINLQTAIDGFKKAAVKSHSFIESTTKTFFIKKHNWGHIRNFIPRLFESASRRRAIVIGSVALALAFSLWYQGILPLKPNPPKLADFQKEPYIPNMGKAGFSEKQALKPSERLQIRAMKEQSTDQQLDDVHKRKKVKSTLPINPPRSSNAAYFVQAGAFRNKENAIKAARVLKKKGYSAKVVTVNDSKGRSWHTIRVGEYASLKLAKKRAIDFSNREKMDSIVLPMRKH